MSEADASFDSAASSIKSARMWSWLDTVLRIGIVVVMVWQPT
jgi:hypothetical protein